MTTPPGPRDFNQLAAHFDRFLPLIHPVGVAVLERLPELAAGATVLDVACGTGEPGLTLARRSPEVRLLGVDQAEALIQVAQAKAEREGLNKASFSLMPLDALQLPAASVDAVISRFGLLMFGDVRASARELARVLRAGGCFSLAVWDSLAENRLMGSLLAILRPHLPAGRSAPMDALQEWAEPERRRTLLEGSGIGLVHTEMFSWDYSFDSFDEAWELVRGMGKLTGQVDLAPEVQEQVRRELLAALATYRQPGGQYIIPHACRLLWGQR